MKILVLGGDGYLGWPTAMHLANRGHDIAVVDSFHRRLWDHEIGADTLIPILTLGVLSVEDRRSLRDREYPLGHGQLVRPLRGLCGFGLQ